MPVHHETLVFQTKPGCDIHEITSKIQAVVGSSGLTEGIACIHVPGSTSSISTIEYEPGAVGDLADAVNWLIPPNARYGHEEAWHDGNGHSHVAAALMGPSRAIPFQKGQLILGTWQQLILIDFDNKPRNRKVVVQLVGE
jgi:secondary thiamine-phosphate synthase enzyme